jgi:hypothetical protein
MNRSLNYSLSKNWVNCVWLVIITVTDFLVAKNNLHIWIRLMKKYKQTNQDNSDNTGRKISSSLCSLRSTPLRGSKENVFMSAVCLIIDQRRVCSWACFILNIFHLVDYWSKEDVFMSVFYFEHFPIRWLLCVQACVHACMCMFAYAYSVYRFSSS